MKNPLIILILLFTIFACSPDNDFVQLEGETLPMSPESLNLESVTAEKQNTANVFNTETFENPELDQDPSLSDFDPEFAADHSFSLTKNIKREGNTAGRFQLNEKDPKIKGDTKVELTQTQNTATAEGWYGFSQYFPDTYVPDSSEEIITQWLDESAKGKPVNRSPTNAIITADDKLKWMIRGDTDAGTSVGNNYIDLGTIPKNRWIDWVVHIKYSQDNSGILEVWMDGIKVIDRQNLTNSYYDGTYPYLKFGLSKSNWGTGISERVMYYDEIRIGNSNSSYDEVKPGGLQEPVTTEPATTEPVAPEPGVPEGATEISTVNELIAGLKSGEHLYLKAGNYVLPNRLIFQNDIFNLQVTGADGAIISGDFKTLMWFQGTAKDIKFNNIKFSAYEGPGTVDYGAGLVYFGNSAENIYFENCTFTNRDVNTNGIKFVSEGTARSKNINILNCTFVDIGRMAIELQNHSNDGILRFDGVTIQNNEFKSLGLQSQYGMAISLSGAGINAMLSDNTIIDAKDRGIEILGYFGLTIANNTFSSPNMAYNPIVIEMDVGGAQYTTNVLVTGNTGTVQGNAPNLVEIRQVDGLVYTKNSFYADALRVSDVKNSSFTESFHSSDGGIGLYVDNGSVNNTFSGSTFITTADNSSTVTFYPGSTGNTLRNNTLRNEGQGGTIFNDMDGGNTNLD